MRPQNQVDPEIINKVFKKYAIVPEKNIAKLMYFSSQFRTTDKVRNYLEVLL